MKLLEHKAKKEKRVNGWDIISAGLGISGWLMIAISAIQPKNPVNMLRLSTAFVILFPVSVGAERLREDDLLSLDRATDYEKALISDRLRFDTVIGEELHRIRTAEEVFAQVPVDRQLEIAQKIGVAPPNYAARQVDPIVQSLHQPIPTQTATEEVDPTGDFDPEDQADQREDSGSRFIMAANVEAWFEEMGDRAPKSLIDEWAKSPGAGIEITDGQAFVVPKKG